PRASVELACVLPPQPAGTGVQGSPLVWFLMSTELMSRAVPDVVLPRFPFVRSVMLTVCEPRLVPPPSLGEVSSWKAGTLLGLPALTYFTMPSATSRHPVAPFGFPDDHQRRSRLWFEIRYCTHIGCPPFLVGAFAC